MTHPLYPVAKRWVGRHVHVHHINGYTYSGILHSVNQHGIYLLPLSHITHQSTEKKPIVTLDKAANGTPATVYSPASFFAFGALSGLTLGALATRPPYYYGGYGGYGYGYGAPYYW